MARPVDRIAWSLSDYEQEFRVAIKAASDPWREVCSLYRHPPLQVGESKDRWFAKLLDRACNSDGQDFDLADAKLGAVFLAFGTPVPADDVELWRNEPPAPGRVEQSRPRLDRHPYLILAERTWDRLDAEGTEWREGVEVTSLVEPERAPAGSVSSDKPGTPAVSTTSDGAPKAGDGGRKPITLDDLADVAWCVQKFGMGESFWRDLMGKAIPLWSKRGSKPKRCLRVHVESYAKEHRLPPLPDLP